MSRVSYWWGKYGMLALAVVSGLLMFAVIGTVWLFLNQQVPNIPEAEPQQEVPLLADKVEERHPQLAEEARVEAEEKLYDKAYEADSALPEAIPEVKDCLTDKTCPPADENRIPIPRPKYKAPIE